MFKEEALQITASNQTIIENGMTFHVRIAITNVDKESARSVVAIGDTIVVHSDGATVLTNGIQKKYNEISYSLDDSDESEDVKVAPKKAAPKAATKR